MIICFSGTGNSQMVADLLSVRLGEKVMGLSGFWHSSVDWSDERRLIWVMPVHSWGMPKVVKQFLAGAEVACGKDAEHYLVCTCGDDCGLIGQMWRKAMRRRGWTAIAAHSVFMPNTYVTLPGFDVDAIEVAKLKMDAVEGRVCEIAHAIKCKSPIDSVFAGRFAWLKSRIIYPLFMRFLTSPEPFRATDACIGCGLCEAVCPLNNVKVTDGKPLWGKNCTLCMGCYHICPRHAVAYGKSTLKKGQWQGAVRYVLDRRKG